MKRICSYCNKKIGVLVKYYPVPEGQICIDCVTGMGFGVRAFGEMNEAQRSEQIKAFFERLERARENGRRFGEGNDAWTNAEAARSGDPDNYYRIKFFKPTYEPCRHAQFNDEHREMILAPNYNSIRDEFILLDYSQILSYAILENNGVVAESGLGRAAVGGLLFGGAGAVVGAMTRKEFYVCSSLCVKVTVSGALFPAFYIWLITSETETNTRFYQRQAQVAQDLAAKFENIIRENEYYRSAAQAGAYTEEEPAPDAGTADTGESGAYSETSYSADSGESGADSAAIYSESDFSPDTGAAGTYNVPDYSADVGASGPADSDTVIADIRKFKQLFDEGILTEEEFSAKKKQLLGI